MELKPYQITEALRSLSSEDVGLVFGSLRIVLEERGLMSYYGGDPVFRGITDAANALEVRLLEVRLARRRDFVGMSFNFAI